jgi:hypothetical protein
MRTFNLLLLISICVFVSISPFDRAISGEIGIKCHITCRCLRDNSVGNFEFVIPVSQSPDPAFAADQACRAYGHRVCTDGCNGTKFSYTYKVTAP